MAFVLQQTSNTYAPTGANDQFCCTILIHHLS